MVSKLCALAVLVLFALVNQAAAQEEECVANSVVNMTLSNRRILSWELDEDEKCNVTQFLVYIFQRDQPVQYSFEVEEPEVDVSFLLTCQEWTFVVVPVAGYVRGHEHRLFGTIPLPSDANLSIDYININRNSITNEIGLTWDLVDTRYGDCSLTYRVTVEHENPEINNIFVNEKSLNLDFLPPCSRYWFGVKAFNMAPPVIEGDVKTIFYEIPAVKQDPPSFQEVEIGSTSLNMTWRFQELYINSCKITEFYVYGGYFFNSSVLYDDDPGNYRYVKLELTSLIPNTMYYMRASIKNEEGWSDPTVVAVQTLDFENL